MILALSTGGWATLSALVGALGAWAGSALVAMGEGDTDAIDVLRRLLRKVRPTLLPEVS
jgi:hypothetical protein